MRAEQTRTEDPRLHLDTGARHCANLLAWCGLLEVLQQFHHVVRELVRALVVPPQCAGSRLVRARRATESEIDAPRIQGRQGAELLGHLQWRVVRQHDAAGTDADRGRVASDVSDQHGRRRTGNPRHVVMFRQPVAPIPQALPESCQVDHVGEGGTRIAAFGDRHEIEDGEWNHPIILPRRSFE